MLDQLIESTEHLKESRRRGGFLLSTFTAVASLFSMAIIYSLFSYNIALAGEKFDLSSLVAPVSVPDNVPPPPQPEIKQMQQNSAKSNIVNKEIRVVNMMRTDEIPKNPPAIISTTKSINLARPIGKFDIGPVESTSSSPSGTRNARSSGGNGNSLEIGSKNISKEIEKEIPPVMKKPDPKPAATSAPIIRSGRVLNGEARDLVKPIYPAPAKAVHASGAVNVQVTIDENGNVTSAKAVSGHPLLRQVSEQAARASKFSSTFLGEQKVKVTGVIVYNFIAP